MAFFKQRIYVASFIFVIASLIGWQMLSDPTCVFTEAQAKTRILEYLMLAKHDKKYLDSPKFSRNDCSYRFQYDGLDGKYEFVFSNWGEVHKWDYARGDLK